MTFGFLTKQQSADLFVTITNNCTNSLPVGKHTIVSAIRSSGGNRSNPCHAPLSDTANRPLPPYPGRKNTSRTPAPQPGLRPDGASFQRKKTDRIDYGPSPQHLYNPHYTNSLFAIYSGRSGMSCLERNLFPLQRKEKIEPFQKETHD